MRHFHWRVAIVSSLALSAAQFAQAQAVGADVIVGNVADITSHGVVGTVRSYSVGTTSCNIGDANVRWQTGNNFHPVISQNVYRLKNGRLEQIGMGWLKHGFTVAAGTFCSGPGGCTNTSSVILAPGCSDPYTGGLNGSQSRLGPRSDVNASTGVYPWPPTIGWVGTGSSGGTTGDAIFKRIQIQQADLDPAQNPGALYFGEGMYVSSDDAGTNGWNNASYRRATVSAAFAFTMQATTAQQKPGIYAWPENGLGAGVPDPNVHLNFVDVVNDGRFYVACKVTANTTPANTWHYEYAVENLDSHRSGGSFHVPLPAGANVVGTAGFKDINYHSGEPYDNTDWLKPVSSNEVVWTSPNSFAVDPLSNALRWSTMYNFWFDCDQPPVSGDVSIGLFRPGGVGEPDTVSVTGMLVPQAPPHCAGDLNGDNRTDEADLGTLLSAWLSGAGGDLNGDNQTDESDLGILLGDWGCIH
ncbi:MAG: hypothetical protein U1D55_05275 [Phycisphaerae bacterium]